MTAGAEPGDPVAGRLRSLVESGLSQSEAVAVALEQGSSPVAVMKSLKHEFGVPIGMGKSLVDQGLDDERRSANDFLRFSAALVLRFSDDATPADVATFEQATGWRTKLRGLIQAERQDEIPAVIARFDPARNMFAELTEEEATQLAAAEIATWEPEMVIIATEETSFGWAFIAQGLKFAETRDWRDQLVGHGPVLVDRQTGVVWRTGSAPPDPVLSYETGGIPHSYVRR